MVKKSLKYFLKKNNNNNNNNKIVFKTEKVIKKQGDEL